MTVSGRTTGTIPRTGLRVRILATCHRWVRFGPWLVVLGAAVMLATLSSSLLGAATGAVLVGLGVAASLWQPRLRRRQSRLRRTR